MADDGKVYQSRIFATRWNGKEMNNNGLDAIDSDEYRDGLIQLLDFGKQFIKRNSKKAFKKEVDGRINLPDYPDKAIEEALINALIHRDYLMPGAEIHIDMYDDRLEISNPGGMFDEGQQIQERDLRKIPSRTRNPIIADIFDRMNYMERRGSGIKNILDLYANNKKFKNKFKPIFYSDNNSFCITLWNMNYKENKKYDESIKKRVIELLTENKDITQNEIAGLLGLSRRTTQRLLKELIDSETIIREGPKKNGKWILNSKT